MQQPTFVEALSVLAAAKGAHGLLGDGRWRRINGDQAETHLADALDGFTRGTGNGTTELVLVHVIILS
jgi:hypothetical protein